MTTLAQLIADLIEALPAAAGGRDLGVELAVTAVEMDLPVESSFSGGRFGTSLPRGRWRSGIALPHGKLMLVVDRTGGWRSDG